MRKMRKRTNAEKLDTAKKWQRGSLLIRRIEKRGILTTVWFTVLLDIFSYKALTGAMEYKSGSWLINEGIQLFKSAIGAESIYYVYGWFSLAFSLVGWFYILNALRFAIGDYRVTLILKGKKQRFPLICIILNIILFTLIYLDLMQAF